MVWFIPEFRHTVLLLNGFHRLPGFGLLSPPYTPYSSYSTQYYREFGYTPFTVHTGLDTHRLQCILVWIHTHLMFTVHNRGVRRHTVTSLLQCILDVFKIHIPFNSAYLECLDTHCWIFTVNIRGVWMQAVTFMNCDIAQRSLDVIDFIVYIGGVWIHT